MGQTRFTGPVKSDAGFRFDTTAVDTPDVGDIVWNANDGTIDVGLPGGVTMQVGQKVYARVANTTGSTIPNGTVVGFAGATPNALLVAPYIANGSSASVYMQGIMTQELPDSGQKGYCTTFGFVRDIDTSAFSPGDVLYASSTSAGALTNVKPTAPNNVVPVAACVTSDATTGTIFVRPTIEQQRYYGVFSDTTSTVASAAYTPNAIPFNATDFALGVSRGTPNSRIITSVAGLYNFQFSSQVICSKSSSHKLWIWPRINGVDVPNSNSEITLSGNGTVLVPSWNWVLSMDAGDYFEIMFAVDDTTISLRALPAETGASGTASFARPAVPSTILTVTQVQQ